MRDWKILLWTGVLVLIAIAIGLFFLSIHPAAAHMKERPDLDEWLMSLYSKHRGGCCDKAEAETMADPDWREVSEMKNDECKPSASVPNDIMVFCVRLESPSKKGEFNWWSVPDDAVVELPNRAGPALIWVYWNDVGQSTEKPYIRCFLPGSLS